MPKVYSIGGGSLESSEYRRNKGDAMRRAREVSKGDDFPVDVTLCTFSALSLGLFIDVLNGNGWAEEQIKIAAFVDGKQVKENAA